MSERYRQRGLFQGTPGLIQTKVEDQWFDRKGIRIKAVDLARHMIGFANADGGTIVVGVEDDGRVTGIDQHPAQVNELRQAALSHTQPPVRLIADVIDWEDERGGRNHLLVFEVHPSDDLHRDAKGDVHLRVGDKTRRLSAEQAHELAYDKGLGSYDATVLASVTTADLDDDAVRAFAESVKLSGSERQVLRARGLVSGSSDQVSPGAVLLFG